MAGRFSRFLKRPSLTFFILFSLSILSFSAPARSQNPVSDIQIHYRPGPATLGMSVPSAPLHDVLDAITRKTGIRFEVPSGMNPVISRSFENLPMERAIKQLLGNSVNAAMIYVNSPDDRGRDRAVLKEVRILGGSVPAASGPVAAVAPPVSAAPPIQRLTPEEIKARRDERNAQRAEKERMKAEQRSGRKGGKEAQPSPESSPPSQQGTSLGSADPNASPAPDGTANQGRRSRRGR
jgi:hypothetical protein